jgi:hypothetical protein
MARLCSRARGQPLAGIRLGVNAWTIKLLHSLALEGSGDNVERLYSARHSPRGVQRAEAYVFLLQQICELSLPGCRAQSSKKVDSLAASDFCIGLVTEHSGNKHKLHFSSCVPSIQE